MTEADSIILVDPSDLECQGSILRQKSKPVKEAGIYVEDVVHRMLKLLYQSEHGTGLSAIQIGIPARIAIVNLSRVPGQEIIMIDPVVISVTGRLKVRMEGCLSLPNYKGPVKRRDKVAIRAKDLRNKEFEFASSGYEAAVIQHEMDHLEGVLYWDRMPEGIRPERITSSGVDFKINS